MGIHIVFAAIAMSPKSRLFGPNIVRLPPEAVLRHEVAITFDDGPDPEITPRVLDILDRYGAKASFFCIGRKVRVYPAIVREIHNRGHSVENHSNRHPNAFAFYGVASLLDEIENAQNAIQEITGRAPLFFRTPMGFRSPLLSPLLIGLGLRYTTWTRRVFDTVRRDPEAISASLIRGLAAGDVLLLHDRSSGRTKNGSPVLLAVLPMLLEHISLRGLKPVSLPMAWGDDSDHKSLLERTSPHFSEKT